MAFELHGKPKPELDGLHQTISGCERWVVCSGFSFLLVVKLHTEKDIDNSPGLEEILINIGISPRHSSLLESCFHTVDCDY